MDPYIKSLDVLSKIEGFAVTLLYQISDDFHGLAIFIGKGKSQSITIQIKNEEKAQYKGYFQELAEGKVTPPIELENKTLTFVPVEDGIQIKLKIGKWWLSPTLEAFLPKESLEQIISAIDSLPA